MQTSQIDFVDNYLNLTPFRQLEVSEIYTLYENVNGEYFKYSNVAIYELSYRRIVFYDCEYGGTFGQKERALGDFKAYGKQWFLVHQS
jgi:hypothetical protein